MIRKVSSDTPVVSNMVVRLCQWVIGELEYLGCEVALKGMRRYWECETIDSVVDVVQDSLRAR
jgi:hypothetical protein